LSAHHSTPLGWRWPILGGPRRFFKPARRGAALLWIKSGSKTV
jgi:hypothetical protein